MTFISIRRPAAVAAGLILLATPASAHHAMDGKLPSTLLEGLLSGLGHPVIGPDHLAFIIAIGIAAALVPAGLGVIGAFIAASTAGVLIHLGAITLPMGELLVAGSVIAAGGLVALGHRAGNGAWLALAVLAGVVHGYAFGEAIVGAESRVIGAYLAGIAIVAAVISAGVMGIIRGTAAQSIAAETRLMAVGAAVACVGVVMLVGGLAG
ncbi:MAG: HupE/UreJ family protein [Hyphomicrobiaceae bacterium]|nr:HupE/UreJ family protein [Hyphomicrobiaceae bacterium]